MALQAHFAVGAILHVTGFPASRMRSHLAAAVALDTDITLRVAGLAGLQIAARFGAVIGCPVFLPVLPQRVVGLDFERPFGETAVAGVAVRFRIVAAIALLRIVLCLHGVDADEVAAVALRLEIAAAVSFGQIITAAAALMTIQTPRLIMTLVAVIAGLAGHNLVTTNKIGIMVGGDTFAFVAGIAVFDRHGGILFMRYLFCVRLLLEIHQGASQKRNYEKELFH